MEINFVRDKDVIDVPTVRGKINRLVLSAITVDPGSNTLLMSKDIAERLGLKIVPLTLAPGCVFHLDFAVIEYDKSMVILSNPFLYRHKYQILGDKDLLKINCNGKDFYIPVTMHKVENKLEVNCATASQDDKPLVSDQISQEADSYEGGNESFEEEWHAPTDFSLESTNSTLKKNAMNLKNELL